MKRIDHAWQARNRLLDAQDERGLSCGKASQLTAVESVIDYDRQRSLAHERAQHQRWLDRMDALLAELKELIP